MLKYFLFSFLILLGSWIDSHNCYANPYIFKYDTLNFDSVRSEKSKIITEKMVRERLAKLESTIKLPYHKNVKGFIDYYVNRNTEYTATMLTRAKVYYPLFEKYLKQYGLPLELKHLAVVESGLNPVAVSRVGATGLWQFMPSTGRLYNLNRDLYFDDRMDPKSATIAACRHLKDLYKSLKSWPLALAAYNSGSGNVRKAIRRSGYKRKFWEIYRRLPRETRAYVPQFIAVMYAMEYAENHEIFEIDSVKKTIIPLDTVFVDGYFNVKTLADDLDIKVEKISFHNPSLLRSSIPKYKTDYPLVLPFYNAEVVNDRKKYFVDRAKVMTEKDIVFKAKQRGRGTYGRVLIHYRVKSGDVLGGIASRFKVRVSHIKNWNKIRGTTIYAGQRLKLYVRKYQKKQYLGNKNKRKTYSAKTAQKKIIDGKNRLTHKVKTGDTLWEIAKGYNVSVKDIKALNQLTSSRIKPNMVLIIK